MPASQVVVFGDSVTWGQGLRAPQKPSAIVARQFGLTEEMLAHSGATIGARDTEIDPPADGEVPVPRPTILRQVKEYQGNPDEAAIVIINGGINDVDIRFILNPLILLTELHRKTVRYCHHDMLTLLKAVSATFTRANLPIVVTSYFPILSPLSDPFMMSIFLAVQGIALSPIAPAGPIVGKIVAQCLQFWRDSATSLAAAVNECGDPRVRLADVPFTEANSGFAPDPWLFGVDVVPPFLPQDDVIDVRHAACNVTFPPIAVVEREACYRASAGHPNRTGAARIAETIIGVVKDTGFDRT